MTVWGKFSESSQGDTSQFYQPRVAFPGPLVTQELPGEGMSPLEGSNFLSSVTGPTGFDPSPGRGRTHILFGPAVETLVFLAFSGVGFHLVKSRLVQMKLGRCSKLFASHFLVGK